MSANRLFIAAAGSGKTKLIIDEVINEKESKILITTFTLANEKSIRERLVKANGGCIPQNINIQTWFSFLIEHGIRPYRFWEARVTGMQLVSEASGIKYSFKKNGKTINVSWAESDDFEKHYFFYILDELTNQGVYITGEETIGASISLTIYTVTAKFPMKQLPLLFA